MEYTILRMVDNNADGCGTIISVLVMVEGKLFDDDANKLQTIVDELKEEWEDWNFDEIVEESCKKLFTNIKGLKYQIISPKYSIEL